MKGSTNRRNVGLCRFLFKARRRHETILENLQTGGAKKIAARGGEKIRTTDGTLPVQKRAGKKGVSNQEKERIEGGQNSELK